jgi:hypothetical protein
VATEDRAEIMAFNQCRDYCEKNYPWPRLPEGADSQKWSNLPSTVRARENTEKCNEECNKRKPKAQPDWSC